MSDKEIAISIEEPCELQLSAKESSSIAGIDELVNAGKGTEAPVQTHKPKIQKVPMVLRDNEQFNKFYDPRAVPIGPIHHKDEKLKLAQQYKPRLTAQFIKESGQTATDLYQKIKKEIKTLKLFFDPEVIKDYKDEDLSWMLFLDGCSTLQFMHGVVHHMEMEKYNIKRDRVAFAQQDLFLLENQIPFKVLTLLIDSSTAKEELIKSIKSFLQTNVMAPSNMCGSIDIDIYKEDPTHLLELLQKFAIHQSTKGEKQNTGEQSSTKDDKGEKQNTGEQSSTKDDKGEKQDTGKQSSTKDDKVSDKKRSLLSFLMREKRNTSEQSFRNIKELKAAGINLKRSKTCSLKDINFTSICFAGWLNLPPLLVDDSTGPKLLNMIAYEMCPDNFRTNYEVSSYVSFLDSLIDNSNDVKELRSAEILYNRLGSDKELARLFNEIATDLVPCPSLYDDVIKKIQKHYENTGMTWMAEFFNTHFSSPWTVLAFLGALIALALTFVQTWYAINPPSENGGN